MMTGASDASSLPRCSGASSACWSACSSPLQLPSGRPTCLPWLTFGRLRPAAHQRGHLRVRRQHDLRRHLLLDAAPAARRAWRQRPARRASTSGAGRSIIVAAAITLPLGHHAGQGIRGARVADRPRDRASSGWSSRSTSSGRSRDATREAPLRRHLVLHRDHHHRRGAAHRQQPGAAGLQRLKSYSIYRRRAGRAGAVVVRPQRRRLLPDHAGPRHHVLLPAEGGGAAGLLVPAVHRPLLGAGLRLHLGRAPPPAQHRAARLGAVPGHGLLPDAVGAVAGAACSTAC